MMLMDQLSNPLVFGPLVVMTVVFVGFMVYKKSSLSFGGKKDFEKESLESLIRPQFVEILDRFGRSNYSTFRRDLMTIAEVYKDVRFNEANDYDDNDSKIKTLELDTDDLPGDLDDLVNAGVITTEQKEEINQNQMVPHRFIQTRPDHQFLKVLWLFTDKLAGKEFFTDYYLVPEIALVDHPSDESISVKRNVEFRPLAGINVPMYESSLGILRSVTMRSLYEQSLEDQSNYHEKINFYDSQFSQAIQQVEAEAEAEAKKYNRGASDDARGG
jgi:hypothetical protein